MIDQLFEAAVQGDEDAYSQFLLMEPGAHEALLNGRLKARLPQAVGDAVVDATPGQRVTVDVPLDACWKARVALDFGMGQWHVKTQELLPR